MKWNSMRFPRSLTENTTEKENNIEENTIHQETGNRKTIREIASACTSRVSTFQHSMDNSSESEFHKIQDLSVPDQRAVKRDEVHEEFV